MPSQLKQTPLRLGDETIAHLDQIQTQFGLPSRAAAVRYAARDLVGRLDSGNYTAAPPPTPKAANPPPKKSRTKSKKND